MKFSVVIPTFNASESIRRAIGSVLEQSEQDFEIIIVDDASTDDTVAVVEALQRADARIRLVRQPVNAGPAAARNRGLDAAEGEWVAMLDADDAFYPTRLEVLGSAAISRDADIIFDNLMFYDWVAGKETGKAIRSIADTAIEPLSTERFLGECLLAISAFDFGQLKCVVRRQFFDDKRLRYPSGLRHSEDFIFYAEALLAGARGVLVGQPLYLFTQRVGALSKASSGQSRTRVDVGGMAAATDGLMQHPGVAGNAVLLQLLQRRRRAIAWHASLTELLAHMRRRDPVGAAAAAVKDWKVAVIAGRLVLRKLGARTSVYSL